ncbi:hypothetical protein FHT80_005231 [Rhizobium sp. BK226]|uniref:hypothetical protein n=1 Tax=Rhizobium sp. BK226 TaxID=2587075 RepID=UPI0016164F08|nr:hypothetical protein [Rhizobium sp. BK226]MBB4115862.1 hypothetical protein [Rhizobium sp. BK226]
MEDFENDYNKAIEAGQRNLKAKKLLANWCFHAEFSRMPGRGMIEEATGLPIGHMGVRCKFSTKNSMFGWLLEDAAYDFYINNCKGCDKRVPVGIPNIMEFVGPRERAIEQRQLERNTERQKSKQQQQARKEERAELRNDLSLEETFVLDLIDELDADDIPRDDPRLEQLANLAPEAFGPKVIDHLLPAATQEHFPYSIHAAKALIRARLDPDKKVAVAVRLLDSYVNSPEAVDYVLAEPHRLDLESLSRVISRFVSMAVPAPPSMRIGNETRTYDSAPIKALFAKRQDDVSREIENLFAGTHPGQIAAATKAILAIHNDQLFEKYARSIFGKLMRRRTLLPKERRDSAVLHYLREAASKCLELSPDDVDTIIQSFLRDNDDIGKQEAHRTYRSILKHDYRRKPTIGRPQRIAFRRLLWAAVGRPDATDDATQFFMHTGDELAELAAEHLDEFIGAAATLSEKYERLEAKPSLEVANEFLAEMERRNKRAAIDSLQGALINWAAIGARAKGKEGIEDFLTLYRRLPENQTQMRGNMIVHVSKLLTGIESLNQVLSDWYRALMDESALVRASAVQAWEDVNYDMEKNFPDLFFQAFAVLLTDPYVIVHRAAIKALRRNYFPEDKRSLFNAAIWNLVVHYAQDGEDKEFLVRCIDVFTMLCLTDEQKKGDFGVFLSGLLLKLEGHVLYEAVDHLVYSFQEVPGFVKVALKALTDQYTRSISTDDCVTVVLRASPRELRACADDIEAAFDALKPFRPEDFAEALLLISALTKAGRFSSGRDRSQALLAAIPAENRYEKWRLQASLVGTAAAIEGAVAGEEDITALIEHWGKLSAKLEIENEERAEIRDVPPHFFFSD